MKRNRLKIAIDIVITAALLLLYNVHADLGLVFHEWAGILIAIGFVLHVALSWSWVVGVTRKFLTTTPRARLLYVVDVLVLVAMAWTIVGGVLISRVATPMLASHDPFWRVTHVPVSYLTLVLVGVHLGLHWEWVLRVVRKMAGAPAASPLARWALRLVAAAVFAAGVWSVVATDAVGQVGRAVASPTAGMPREAGQAPGGGRGPGRGMGPGAGMGRGEGMGPGGGMGRGERRGAASGSDLTSLALHGGVVAAFAVPVYYLDAAWVAVRRRRRVTPAR